MMLRRCIAAFAVVSLASSAFACSSASSPPSDGGIDSPSDVKVRPVLIDLSVTAAEASDGSPPLSLVPPFSSGIFDYYVRCAAGENALTITMTASPGADSVLLQPAKSASLRQQTLSQAVNEGQAVVAAATEGQVSQEYWIRCLPHDFPPMRMDLHGGAGARPPGYYLLGNSVGPGTLGYVMILNGDGVPVWYVSRTSGTGVDDIDDVVPGALSLFSTFTKPSVEILHLESLKATYSAPRATVLDTHELRVLRNGHYLVISSPTKSGVDLTGMTIPLGDGGTLAGGPNSNILDCEIVEFDPTTGVVAWKWVATKHFDAVKDSTVPEVQGTAPDGGPLVDVFHCNSIDVDPIGENLLVSSRNMDSVFYIDRSTSKILWKMGGRAYNEDEATYVRVEDPFYRQHDARLQPGWSEDCGRGQVSVFDDHTSVHGVARGLVLDVVGAGDAGVGMDCGSADGGPHRATVAWEYDGETRSGSRGSFRILADGSRTIGWGETGTQDLVFTEVDVEGHDLVDFYFTDRAISYRVIKVPVGAFDLGVLRRTTGP